MFILCTVGLLGFFAGVAVNYLADILPIRRRLAAPVCLHCGEAQPWGNYLFWPRRCVPCGTRRGARTWVVEIVAVLLTLALWRSPMMRMQLGFVGGLAVLVYFGVVTVIDVEWKLILHPVSVFGAVFGLLAGIYLHGVRETLTGGALGYGVMFALYYLGFLFAKLAAKLRGEALDDEVALGFGDVNLTGVLGLLLGVNNILLALLLSILFGALFSVFYLFWRVVRGKYKLGLAIPYGPFLVLGAFYVLYTPSFAQQILFQALPLFSVSN